MIRTRSVPTLALVAGLLLATVGCAGEDSSGAPTPSALGSGSPSASSASSSPTAEETPFTEPGSELEIGQTGKVRWSPRQRARAELEITVTALQRTTFKQSFAGWRLDGETTKRSPFFIRAEVTNIGERPIRGGVGVPLYGLDAADNLVEASTFDADFPPCQPATLPKTFGPGDTLDACLVVLVPDKGKLVGATYRPSESVDPITWTGPLESYRPSENKNKPADQGRRGAD